MMIFRLRDSSACWGLPLWTRRTQSQNQSVRGKRDLRIPWVGYLMVIWWVMVKLIMIRWLVYSDCAVSKFGLVRWNITTVNSHIRLGLVPGSEWSRWVSIPLDLPNRNPETWQHWWAGAGFMAVLHGSSCLLTTSSILVDGENLRMTTTSCRRLVARSMIRWDMFDLASYFDGHLTVIGWSIIVKHG